tara:strand:+ start:718 stop:1881 length:1164 start_codon:yes stop_codon:yes gene_type:complete
VAEKEGIGSLPYYEDPEALELARKASEQMMSQEMDLEFDKELPPAMRTGGIYALFSDLGKSVPGLEYHSFNTVPSEARDEFEDKSDLRQEYGFDTLNREQMLSYPLVKSGGVPVSGLYLRRGMAELDDPKNRDELLEIAEELGLEAPERRFDISYEPPISSRRASHLSGEQLANMQTQSFKAYEVEPGGTYPGFLTGPSIPSVNVELNEQLLPFPKYQRRRAGTHKHELMHAGANHPRFESFMRSQDYYNLPERVKDNFRVIMADQHVFTGPLARYAENYRQGAENNVVEFILSQAEKILGPNAAQEGVSQEGQDTARLMLQAAEKGGDPLHQYARRVGFDEADRKVLNDLETMSFYFGEYLNRTADPETGKQAYTAVEKLDQLVPR